LCVERSIPLHPLQSAAAIRPRPVDPPTPARHWNPEQRLRRRAAHVVVKCGCAVVETARVPGVPKPEPLVVEVVAELMAERAQKRPKGGDLLADGRPHPYPDQRCF